MKVNLFCALIAVACVGCKSTTFTTTAKDGTLTKASDRRFLMSTGVGFEMATDTNGTRRISTTIQSSPQAEMAKSIAEGVAAGFVRGAKP